jgi:hypothetical protein
MPNWFSVRSARMERRARRAIRVFPVALLLLGALVGCSEDDSQRQFANDAPSVGPPSPVSTVGGPSADVTATPVARVASPAALLLPRGAPRSIYLLANGELWTMSSADRAPRRFFQPQDQTLRAIASSPSGDRVALLAVKTNTEAASTTLIVLGADGSEIRRLEDLESTLDLPASVHPVATALEWSPQGDQLVSTFEGGGIVSVPLDARMPPLLLVSASVAPLTTFAAWSPAGDQIAYINATAPGAAADLWVVRTGDDASTPIAVPARVVAASENGATITALAWRPDGSSIFYTQTSVPGGAATGGDVFSIAPSGADRRVVASAGRAAPVAEVVRFAPSPDGRSAAYTVFVPRAEGLVFHSLWVRPLGGGQSIPLAVPNGETVTDLWWSAAGLVFRTVPSERLEGTSYSGGAWSLYLAHPSGPAERLFAMDGASPVASASAEAASPEPEKATTAP